MSERYVHGYGVVVGVGADLPMTVNDAQGVARLLRDAGRCAYVPEQVQLLTGNQAHRDAVLGALDTLAQQSQADPDATVVVYFSGHGLEMPGYHLMPYGYDVTNLTSTAISGLEFTTKLQAIQAQKLVVLLDCCHAGGIGETKDVSFAKSPVPPALFDTLKAGSGRVMIASSRRDEVSWAFKKDSYSAFTAALLQALAGYGAFEQDGYARVLDVALWVGRKVPERTRDRQHPIIKVSNLENNFALAYYAGGAKSPKSLEWDAPVPLISEDLDAAQVTAWRRMWVNCREGLMLIEERMSEYVIFTDVPLQLVRSKRQIEAQIADLERKLGLQG